MSSKKPNDWRLANSKEEEEDDDDDDEDDDESVPLLLSSRGTSPICNIAKSVVQSTDDLC